MHSGRSRAHPPLTPVRLAHAMLAQASSSALASLSYSAKKRKSSAAKKKRTSHASRDATWTYKNVSNKCVALRETASFPSRVTGFGIVPDQVVCVDKRLDKSVRGIKVRFLRVSGTLPSASPDGLGWIMETVPSSGGAQIMRKMSGRRRSAFAPFRAASTPKYQRQPSANTNANAMKKAAQETLVERESSENVRGGANQSSAAAVRFVREPEAPRRQSLREQVPRREPSPLVLPPKPSSPGPLPPPMRATASRLRVVLPPSEAPAPRARLPKAAPAPPPYPPPTPPPSPPSPLLDALASTDPEHDPEPDAIVEELATAMAAEDVEEESTEFPAALIEPLDHHLDDSTLTLASPISTPLRWKQSGDDNTAGFHDDEEFRLERALAMAVALAHHPTTPSGFHFLVPVVASTPAACASWSATPIRAARADESDDLPLTPLSPHSFAGDGSTGAQGARARSCCGWWTAGDNLSLALRLA